MFENKRAEIDGVLVKKGNIFERFNFDCNSVNAMQRCFGLIPIIVKAAPILTNMMKTGNYLKSVMRSNIDARIC